MHMIEHKIMIEDTEAQFLENFAEHGFGSMSELISKALELLKKDIDKQKRLLASASLYAEIYDEDEELQEWTDAATCICLENKYTIKGNNNVIIIQTHIYSTINLSNPTSLLYTIQLIKIHRAIGWSMNEAALLLLPPVDM